MQYRENKDMHIVTQKATEIYGYNYELLPNL